MVELATTSSAVKELVDPIMVPRREPRTFLGEDSAKEEDDVDVFNIDAADEAESNEGMLSSWGLVGESQEASD